MNVPFPLVDEAPALALLQERTSGVAVLTLNRPEQRNSLNEAMLAGLSECLAAIAQDLGFSDQPHMTRAVKWLTGRTPDVWRRGVV